MKSIVFFCTGFIVSVMISNGYLTQFIWSHEQELVVRKAQEEFGAKKITFKKEQNGSVYDVLVNDEPYTFTLSNVSVHVDRITSNNLVVYKSSPKNIDEGLNSLVRAATLKVREVTGHEEASLYKYLDEHEFPIKIQWENLHCKS